MFRSTIFVSALAVLFALGGNLTLAEARTFTVSACDAASGLNRSWVDDSSGSSSLLSRQHCPALGATDGLLTRSTTLPLAIGKGEGSGWRFDAAAGTSIVGVDWAGEYWTSSAGWAAGLDSSVGRLFGCGPSSSSCSRRWTAGERPISRSVSGASWLRFGIRCVASSSCRTGSGGTHPNALASAWYLRVKVDDPTPPTVALSGDATAATWVKPGATLVAEAGDATGIASVSLDRAGTPISVLAKSCDYNRARPCNDASARYSLGTDGLAEWGVTATDAAGNSTRSSRLIGVDGTPPAAPTQLQLAGGDAWRTFPHFDLTWDVANESGEAPVVRTTLTVCPASQDDIGCMNPVEIPADGRQAAHVRLPHPGDWIARVTETDAAGNSDPSKSSSEIHLRWDATIPAAPSLQAPRGWLTRDAAVAASVLPFYAGGTAEPLSGIAGWAWSVGSDPGDVMNLAAGSSIPIGGLPEGESELRVRSISGAGYSSRAVATALVRIDETAPQVDLLAGDGTWSSTPQTVSVRGIDQPRLSGFGGGGKAEARIWLDGELADREDGGLANLELSDDGIHLVSGDVTDAAGNRSGRPTAVVKVDRTAPERVEFIPQDSADPRIVRVYATDATSGVDSVSVRLRPIAGGDWRVLPTELRGARYEAVLDDGSYAPGQWEMEATAIDKAGNTAATIKTNLGGLAVVSFPLRSASRIEAHMGLGSGSAGAASLDSLPHGKGGNVSGRILGARDLPVEGAAVTLESAPLMAGGEWTPVSSERTDFAGRFAFSVAPGPSRRFRLKWSGDHRSVGSGVEMAVRVPALTTIGANPRTTKVGASSTFSGRLDGGWLPATGKLVLVQAFIPNRGWQTFASARSDLDGVWRASYRFRAAVGRVRYSIRAFVPAESGYPFAAAATAPIHVTVIG